MREVVTHYIAVHRGERGWGGGYIEHCYIATVDLRYSALEVLLELHLNCTGVREGVGWKPQKKNRHQAVRGFCLNQGHC